MSDANFMDWDADISADSNQIEPLEEGDYNFTVESMNRIQWPGSTKIPAGTNALELILDVDGRDGKNHKVKYTLVWWQSVAWKIGGFLTCVGLKKKGENVKFPFNKIVGSMGRAHFTKNDKGYNDINKTYDYDPAFFKDTGSKMQSIDNPDLPY